MTRQLPPQHSLSTLAPSAFSRDVPPLEIGEAAPGFALQGLDGSEVTLAALDGKVVVLNFWASWCGPCRLEMPDFQKAWEEHREQGVVFVGIAVDDTASEASKFAEQVGVTYPLALDTTGDVARSYRIRAVPSTYFIDREGSWPRLYRAWPIRGPCGFSCGARQAKTNERGTAMNAPATMTLAR